MQKIFLVINKDTQVSAYLTHRSIAEITEEHRSLAELDPKTMSIIDADKLVIIHYQSDDNGLSFRSDMNALRNLLSSAFFHVDELVVILVNFEDPLAEDLIFSATRDSNLTRDKIEINHHEGTLMLSDVGHYLAGSAAGQAPSSTFKSVYVREADKEERDRFDNVAGSDGLDSVLPALTDMTTLYRQRAHVEAISAGRVVTESATRPETVNDFSKMEVATTKTLPLFVVSGEQWTGYERAASYLVEYARVIGRRVLVVNTNTELNIAKSVGECVEITTASLKVSSTPSSPVAVLNVRFNQLGYVAQFLNNILGVEEIIFNVALEDYRQMYKFARQMSDEFTAVYVAHFEEASIQRFIRDNTPATSLFLTFEKFNGAFDLESYREDLKGIVVGKFPTEDVDVIEFRDLATGAKGEDEDA